MAKNLNVNLAFTADASQARAELNALKKSLNELVSGTALKTPDFQFTKDIQDATKAAAQLKVQLDNAINVKTGNLDLTKFNEQMNKSGMSLEKYQNQLYQLGPAGEKAFADLARSITMADIPLRRSSKLLDELWTTMKNTARWQLTSSAMHGFMGAVQSAYHYAQDLNGSLNEIRIVTGASVDKMAEFAKEANLAAKALSTTTTEYTNASLIFYQQGLNDSEVKERTDITIKMANAAGASAEKVSNQLTAVWNNFYDGSKSLEYYADVMTALGAATASSTDEIAGGLEKFAAIGDTIGLSYEYAASALATITSNTRQSEEVVGTALKTIFARIQGLNLGETLDDGTTLNKYSKALESVGISIFDSAGEMKKMDTILDEMAAKWDTLSKAQQAALAQTVAGTRQYTQLVALMDNWNNGDSDSMTANLETSYGASGALQEQADIYAESWEAAQKRVQASTEAVYSAILNDEFFIGLTNGFADLIDGVKTFIDSLGGIKGVLLTIGSIVTSVFSKQISQGISNAIYNIKSFVNPKGVLNKEIEQKKEVNQRLIDGYKDDGTTSGSQSALAHSQLGVQQNAYIENAANMSEEEQKINQILMDRNRLLADEVVKSGEILQKTEEQILRERKSLQNQASIAAGKNGKSKTFNAKALEPFQKKVEAITKSYSTLNAMASKVELTKDLEKDSEEFKKLKINIQDVVKSLTGLDNLNTDEEFEQLGKALGVTGAEARKLYQDLENAPNMAALRKAMTDLETTSLTGSTTAINDLRNALMGCGVTADQADDMMKDYLNAINQFGPNSVQATESLNKLKTGVSNLSKEMEKSKPKPMALGEAFSKAAGAVMAVGQAFSTIKGIIDVFNDEQSTTGDKIMALVSGIGMLIPTILAIAPAFSTASVSATLFGTTATAAGTAASIAMWQVTLIVAAITAIIAIVAILVSQQESAEKKAKEAAKAAEAAAESLEETKQAAEDLKSSFDGYNSAVEKLKECTKGTKEWKEALLEVNDAALEVIENLPDNLTADEIKSLYNTDNGYIEFNEGAIEKYQTQANSKVMAATMSKAVADKMSVDTKVQVELKDALNDLWNSGYASNISNYGTDKLSEILFNNLDQLQGLDVETLQQKLRDLGISVSDLGTDDLVNFQQKINECAVSTEGASEKMKLIIGIQLEEKHGEMSEAERTGLTNVTGIKSDEYADDYYRVLTGNDGNTDDENAWEDLGYSSNYGGINQGSGSDNAVFQQIMKDAERYGLDWEAGSDNAVQGNDSNRTFYLSIDGGESKNYSARDIANKLSAARALYETDAGLAEIQSILSSLEQEDSTGALESILGTGEISVDSLSDLSSITNGNLSQKLQDAYNNMSATEKELFEQAYGDIDTLIAKTDSQVAEVQELQSNFESIDIGNGENLLSWGQSNEISLDAAKELYNTLTEIENIGTGNVSSEDFIQNLTDMVAGIEDPEDKAEALNKLASIDWTSWDAMDQAAAVVEEFGGSIDLTDEKWENFTDDVRKATLAFPQYNELRNTLQDIAGIVKDLEFGAVIDEEDYEQLVAYNSALKELFMLQADGTRIFIGDGEAMQEMVESNLAAMRTDMNLRRERAELVKETNAGDVFGVTDKETSYNFSAVDIDTRWGDGKDGKLSASNENVKNYWGRSEDFASGEEAMNWALAAEGDQAWNSEEIRAILEEQGYSEAEWNELIASAKEGSTEGLQAALDYVAQYINEDYEAAELELDEMVASTASTIEELEQLWADGAIVNESAYDKQLSNLAMQASSLEELQRIQDAGLSSGTGLDSYEYGQALLNLATNYDNCTQEMQDYEAALLTGDEAQIEAAKSALELSVQIGELSKKYGLDAEDVETHAKLLQESAEGYELTAEQAANLAVANRRMNKGVSTLNKNWKDWSKILKSSDRTTADYADTLNDAHEALADLVGAVDAGSIPLDFLDASTESGAQHLEWMEQAANGDTKAINQLGVALTASQVELMEFNEALVNSAINSGQLNSAFNLDSFNAYKTEVMEGITALQTAIQNGTISAGQNITGLMDGTGASWVDSLNQMAMATGMSVDQMNAMLNQLGVQAKVDVVDVNQTMKVPTYTEVSEPMSPVTVWNTTTLEDGTIVRSPSTRYSWKKYTIPGPSKEVEGTVQVAQISTEDGSIGAPQITYTGTSGGNVGGGISPSSTSSGGGGGSSPSAPETAEKRTITKKSDVSERYREVTDAIDNVTDALTRAERATDRLWGKDKLNAMREENKILEEQRDLILKKAEEAEKYAKEDAQNLRDVANDIGVSVTIDQETGDITNIEDVEETLYSRLAAAEAEYNAKVDAYNKYVESIGDKPTEAQVEQAERMKDALDAYEEDIIGGIEDDISAWEDAEQQFQESVETWEDAGLEAEEILDQIMQNNYDIIMEGLEIPLSLNEEDLRLLELQLAQIEDDVYSMAEAVALTSDQLGEYQDNLRLADEALEELNKARELGRQGDLENGITEAAYQEGLAEIRDKYYENVEALMELDKAMEEYYGNTIDMANEELAKYTDQMEHQTSVLEHYQSLIELMGKSNDYDMVGKVLEGQVKTTRDALDVSTEWYNKQRENADSLAADYAAAQARGASEAELEIIKNNWDAAEAAANEAQDKMLSDAEAWAESLKAVLENDLSKIGQTLENALTGGTSFDTINTQWERAQSLQEEYLTTTNQIYETNKLMRTAQQEIDKTTNSAAKKRLKAYIEETEQLQNQSKLSQYELEIQQAKYDLLLAEMALEEAQDAKSTVRLQRDAEGNFGYVYTADSSKLAEAQQQLEDAQNSLYNIGLEGANDYAQKYQQTLQEMYDTYADIQQQKLDGAFETEEEYHRAMEEAKAYYYQKLQDYSGLYSVAVSTDSRVVADAWSSDFASMVYDTDEWMQAVDQYATDAINAFTRWQNAVTGTGGVTDLVGSSVEEVGGKVQDVTDKSHELAETTTKEVIPALDKELDAVQNMTGAYAAMRQEIQAVIEEYTNMINRMNNSQTNDWNSGDDGSGGENNSDTGDGDSNGGDTSGDGNNGGGNSNNNSDTGGGTSNTGGSDTSTVTTELTWDRIMAAYDNIVSGKWGKGLDNRIANGKNDGFTEEEVRAAQEYINYTFPKDKNGLGYSHDKAKDLMGFDTGGYTGDWAGSYGKLALLHKKELVLEPGDTENLLASMEVLDRIIEMIDLQSMSSQIGGLLTTPAFGYNGGTSGTLEQSVHIEASFPGVQDRTEIEEAFNNLINKASQYANRK